MPMKSPTSVPQREVPSPCIGICALDCAGVCSGCGRTIAEIGEWPSASNRRRLEVRALAAARQSQQTPASRSKRHGEQQ
jgi:uncharacterized protein